MNGIDGSATSKRDLFPEIEPQRTGMLAVGGKHEIYWEESGRADGLPVVVIHGGPGSGSSPRQRRYFDPDIYRIVVFDQRGAGRSRPIAEIEDNTAYHLIDDIEKLRRHLGVERWVVFGGSWGSTLGIMYGEAHTDRCLGFLLRGIGLWWEGKLDWNLYHRRFLLPEAWEFLVEPLNEAQRKDILATYHTWIHDPDPKVHMPAARRWKTYEKMCEHLPPLTPEAADVGESADSLAKSRIQTHYYRNRGFVPEDEVFEKVRLLRHLPAVIVHGRLDLISPIVTARRLAASWPEAEFIQVVDGGHSAFDPAIRPVLVDAAERMAARLRP